ncbi:MAG: CDP-glycerol glycerophosphotransferase family protein [Sediminibacterium sp.]
MKKRNLVICRDNGQLFNHWIRSFKPDASVAYSLATEDIHIRNLCKKYDWVEAVYFIEKVSAFFTVAKDVLSINGVINSWLQNISDLKFGFPITLLYFNRHVEGGYTSQRVQDLLLLIDSYQDLIVKMKCDEIILIKSNIKIWEDDVLVAVANALKTKVVIVEKINPRYLLNKSILLSRTFLYEPFYFLQFLQLKVLAYKYKDGYSNSNKVVFQLCSSSKKHVDNLLANMSSLKDGKYSPVVLSWGAAVGVKQIKKNSFHIDILEKSLSFTRYLQSIFKIIYTWYKAKKYKHLFFSEKKLEYSGVDISNLLWFSIRHFIWAELGNRWRISQAAKTYFKNNLPLAISPWGINDLPEGRMIIDALREYKRPLIFKYYLSMVMYETPYREVFDLVDLYLVGGRYQLTFNVEKLGIPEEKNAVVGQARYDSIRQFQIETSKSESLKKLGVPDIFELYILFDYSNALRGYISASEIHILFNKLLDFANQNKNVALLVKPHPNANLAAVKSYSLPANAFLLDKHSLPYHGLNACDVFITKYSTVGFESMLLNRPVISVILDGENSWRVFGNAAEYMNNIDDLEKLLDRFLNSKKEFLRWEALAQERQENFINDVFGRSKEQSSVLTARAISCKLDLYLKKHGK